MEKLSQKQVQLDVTEQNLNQQPKQKALESQHFQNYLINMNLPDKEALVMKRQSFLESTINLPLSLDLSFSYERPFSANIIEFTSNFEYMVIKVLYHAFSFNISILNIDEVSQSFKIPEVFKGGFSSIYRSTFKGFPIATKCTPYVEDTFKQVFFNVLKQYLAFKIAEMFQIGPLLSNPFGFDLIIYNTTIEFSMQFAEHELPLSEISTIENDLKDSLLKLHFLRIVHCDIKPDNICFSPSFQKYVFIDFGLHRALNEDIGFKTWLPNFRGSLLYCSKQVAESYLVGERMVDVYYSDSQGLVKSLREIQSKQERQFELSDQQTGWQLLKSPKFVITAMKFMFINANYNRHQKIKEMSKVLELSYLKTMGLHLQEKFLSFVLQLNYTQNITYLLNTIEPHLSQFHFGHTRLKMLQNQIIFQPFLSVESQGRVQFNKRKQLILSSFVRLDKNHYEVGKFVEARSSPTLNQHFLYFTARAQVNLFGIKFQEKQKLCHVFRNVYLKDKQLLAKANFQELLGECFFFVLKWIQDHQEINKDVYLVLTQTITTVVLLEFISQKQLFGILQKIINKKCPLIRYIRLIFHILGCFEWNHKKYESKYNFFNAMQLLHKNIRQAVSKIKSQQTLCQREKELVSFLIFMIEENGYLQKISKMINRIQKLITDLEKTNYNVVELLSSQNQYEQAVGQIYLYIIYCIFKENGKNLFKKQYTYLINFITNYQLVVLKKISYYYCIRYYSGFQSDSPRLQIKDMKSVSSYFIPYKFNKLFVQEQLLQINSSYKAMNIVESTKNYYTKHLSKISHSRLLIIYSMISLYVQNIQDSSKSVEIPLNINIDQILLQFSTINSLQNYHNHQIISYLSQVFRILSYTANLCIFYKERRIDLQSQFATILRFIEDLSCIPCKIQALLLYNQYVFLAQQIKQQYHLQQSYIQLVVHLIKDQKLHRKPLPFQIIQKMFYVFWYFQEDSLGLLYDWTLTHNNLISIFIIQLTKNDDFFYVKFMQFIWIHRFSLNFDHDQFFQIIVHLCEFLTFFGNQSQAVRFGQLIYILTANIKDYKQFFRQNYQYFLPRLHLYPQNIYLSLYLAVILHPYSRDEFISNKYYNFICTKMNELDDYSQRIIRTYLFNSLKHKYIYKINKNQRCVKFIRKKEMNHLNVGFMRWESEQNIKLWADATLTNLRKKEKRRINSVACRTLIQKFKKGIRLRIQ